MPLGPLAGIRVVELAGQGPVPHASMILGDWGAEVVRVVRPGIDGTPADLDGDPQLRNRTVVAADLKSADDVSKALELICQADVLLEGFRPGVTERLGLGPGPCLVRNPGLVYARMTGWGQTGPCAATAGHDINYIAITGMLEAIGPAEKPVPPLNLVGDYGGGSMYLLAAVLAALLERATTGLGQILDVAIIDGVNQLAQHIWAMRAMGVWGEQRAANMLDGGAPYYGVYACADGRHVAVGAVEQKFYRQLVDRLGLAIDDLPDRDSPQCWPELRAILAQAFSTKNRDDWVAIFDGTDACLSPVLTMGEARRHPQQLSRGILGDVEGVPQALPGPLFGRHPRRPVRPPGSDTDTLDGVARRWSIGEGP
jgi:alpha-methylacyl-CoA racemase